MRKYKYPADCRANEEHRALYNCWKAMLDRVRPDYEYSHRYYFRGIRVCQEWTWWPNFCRWAKAAGWRKDLEIDRRNNDAGYEPSNCRFVNDLEQTRNRDKANLVRSMRAVCARIYAKPFRCVETGRVFNTEMEASREMGVERRTIGRHLRGQYKQAGGYHFEYVEDSTGGVALTAQRN